MPFFEQETTGLRGSLAREPELPKPPGDFIGAAIMRENPVVALAHRLAEESFPPDPGGHNPLDVLKDADPKYRERHLDRFIGSMSERQTRQTMARIDREDGQMQTIEAAGWAGTVASIFAGSISPELFLPGGQIARGVRGGFALGRTAVNTGIAGAAATAGSETLLHAAQETRTVGESVVAVGASTLLAGLIGGGVAAAMTRAERKLAEQALVKNRESLNAHVAGDSAVALKADGDAAQAVEAASAPPGTVAADAGAAVADTRMLEPVDYFLNKIPGWSRVAHLIGTDLGIYSALSVVARRHASELWETTLRFKQNLFREYKDPVTGETRVLAPEVTSPVVPLSREVDIQIGKAALEIGDEVKRLYSDYFFGDGDASIPFLRAQFQVATGRSDKMTPDLFDAEVATAMQKGDQHAIPQVQQAAQIIRQKMEPLLKRMEQANPDFVRQEFGPGQSYFPYKWLNEKIAAQRPQFVDEVVFPHLKADQTAKAAAKERLEFSAAQLRSWEGEISKFEARLEAIDRRRELLGARFSERAMEVRRGEKRVDTLEDRAGSIAEEISEIEEFVAAMRPQLRDPEMLARLDEMDREARALKRADKPMTEAQLRKVEQEELSGILTTPEVRMAAEIVTGHRKPPARPSFIKWLVKGGGIEDDGGEVAAAVGGPNVVRGLIKKEKGPVFADIGGEKRQGSHEIAERIREENPGMFPDGPPSRDDIVGWIRGSQRGQEPEWLMADVVDSPAYRADAMAQVLESVFDREGISVKGVRDVAKILRDERSAPMTLADLDRRVREMEEVGQDIPVSIRREAAEDRLLAGRQGLADLRATIDRAKAASASRERDLGKADARTGEAEFGARQNRGRLGILDERMDAADRRRELIVDALAIAGRNRDEVRAKIEAEIAKWEGKSTGEAVSAIKAREKYAKDTARAADAPRLTSADSSVDTVVDRIIKSDRDLSDIELRDKAEEIVDHILGTPVGRIPYDAHTAANLGPRLPQRVERGPMKARDFAVPYDLAREWLSHDLNKVLASWYRTMVPDTALFERFPGEGPAMTSVYRSIQEDYARLVREATTAKARTRLNKEKDLVIKTIDGVVQRIRHNTNNTEGTSGRVGEAVRRINQMTDLGFAAITSVADFAGPVFTNGLMNTFRDGWMPYLRALGDPALVKASRMELRAMNVAAEIENATRGQAFAEISDQYHPRTQGERVLKYASDRFFLVNMQAQETNAAKRINGRVVMNAILRAVQAEVEGKATRAQIVALRESNIDARMSKRIWDQFNAPDGGSTIDGVYLSNSNSWSDEAAKLHYTAAVSRDVERGVVTPGQEKPLWLSSNAGSLLGQYKSFSMSATNKILIANLQRRDAQSLQGLMAAVALGALSYRISTAIRGQPWPERPQDVVKEGLSRSGVLGILEDANMFAAKATRGTVDLHRLYGADKPLSRNVNRTILSNLLGPTAGKIENIAKVTGNVASGEWNESDTHALRRLIAMQNVFYLNGAFDAVEKGFNNAFGIEMKAKP